MVVAFSVNMELNENQKRKIRKVFEPRYKRKLTDEEVVTIANSLANFVEVYAKAKWREKYGAQYAKGV